MKLFCEHFDREVDFGCIFNGPGARGFDGEGYWFHAPYRRVGLNWDGIGFAGKTFTLEPNAGNMPLQENLRPKEWFPNCIKAYFRSGHMVNAVGLSNPGVEAFMKRQSWLGWEEPIMLSYMPKGDLEGERLDQTRALISLFRSYLKGFKYPVALQLNVACPNARMNPSKLYDEVLKHVSLLRELGVPLIVNFNALVPVKVLVQANDYVDAFWIANTVPWSATEEINWNMLEPGGRSPLPERLGDVNWRGPSLEVQEQEYRNSKKKGGLSGPMCLPLGLERVRAAREAGVTARIVVGNGIQRSSDVTKAWEVGANGIAIATVALVRPSRVPGIKREAGRIQVQVGWDMPYEERSKFHQCCSDFNPCSET